MWTDGARNESGDATEAFAIVSKGVGRAQEDQEDRQSHRMVREDRKDRGRACGKRAQSIPDKPREPRRNGVGVYIRSRHMHEEDPLSGLAIERAKRYGLH